MHTFLFNPVDLRKHFPKAKDRRKNQSKMLTRQMNKMVKTGKILENRALSYNRQWKYIFGAKFQKDRIWRFQSIFKSKFRRSSKKNTWVIWSAIRTAVGSFLLSGPNQFGIPLGITAPEIQIATARGWWFRSRLSSSVEASPRLASVCSISLMMDFKSPSKSKKSN